MRAAGTAATALLALALLVFALTFAFDPAYQAMREDRAYYEQQRQALELERRHWQLEQEQQRQGLDLGLELVGYGLIGIIAGGVAYLVIDAYRQRRTPLVRPDAHGQFPVSRHQIETGDLLPLTHEIGLLRQQVEALRAVHQPGQLPASLHYSPTFSPGLTYSSSRTTPPGPAVLPGDIAPEEAVDAPTLAQLLDRSRVGRGNPLILGYEGSREIAGSWLDLYATITAGLPGTGKTTTQRFFAAQTALHGARFAIADPHAGAADDSLAATLEPLQAAYLAEPASEPKAILDLVRYVADIGEQRVKGRSADRTPIVLWLDELTGLLGRSDIGDTLAETLERIAQEYRKRFVYLSASGQIWTAARTTSELRDSFASVICHRMKRSQARLLLPTDEATTVERLETGQAVLWRTSGATSIIRIPNTTAEDVRRVARLLEGSIPATEGGFEERASVAAQWPPNSQDVATNGPATIPLGRAKAASAEAMRAAGLFLAGKDPAEVVKELRGVTSREGSRYQKALAEVLELIRQGVGQGVG